MKGHHMKTFSSCLVVMALSVGLGVAQAGAMSTVTQLNITGGSIGISLNGSTFPLGGPFSTTGAIVMGTYQPPPNIVTPFSIGAYDFELVTNPGANPGSPLPAPSAIVNGSTITADLQSLHAQITGPLIPGGTSYLNIGNQAPGMAQGTYDANTGAFEISWLHLYVNEPQWMKGIEVSLNGNAQVPQVPLPAAVWLFGTGLLSMPWIKRVIGGNTV